MLIGRLEIVDVQHLAGPGRLAKARQQGVFLGNRHVLALASANRLRLERFDAALVISHVGTVDRAQRNPHRGRNRRLRQTLLTQQYHLDASALLLRHSPVQRCSQPANLALRAFDHLIPRIKRSQTITLQPSGFGTTLP